MIPQLPIPRRSRKKRMTPENQQSQPLTRFATEPLAWQSRLLCLAVIPVCGAWLVLYTHQFWTIIATEGLAICAAFGLLVWRLRAATAPAALTGFILTATMYLATADPVRGHWFYTAFP